MASQSADNAMLFSVPFVQSASFAGLPLTHGFFGRRGGVSTGFFDSLNTGFSVGDTRGNALENCARICHALRTDPQKRYGLNQVHSAICHTITDQIWTTGQAPDGDALVTCNPDITLSVLTADCAPVLFASDTVVGAAHAGWGGALKGVLESTLEAMEQLGAKNIRAAIGPCIGPKSYEVSTGFEKPFLAEDSRAEIFFKTGAVADKLFFDLAGYCAYRLARAGIGHVDILGHDTCALEDQYFSHRRSTRRAEPARGLQMSAICLKAA